MNYKTWIEGLTITGTIAVLFWDNRCLRLFGVFGLICRNIHNQDVTLFFTHPNAKGSNGYQMLLNGKGLSKSGKISLATKYFPLPELKGLSWLTLLLLLLQHLQAVHYRVYIAKKRKGLL